jgi:hypothetical protein
MIREEDQVMDNPALTAACPTCGAAAGKPCTLENGSNLSDPHLARKTLASVLIAKAKKQSTESEP